MSILLFSIKAKKVWQIRQLFSPLPWGREEISVLNSHITNQTINSRKHKNSVISSSYCTLTGWYSCTKNAVNLKNKNIRKWMLNHERIDRGTHQGKNICFIVSQSHTHTKTFITYKVYYNSLVLSSIHTSFRIVKKLYFILIISL